MHRMTSIIETLYLNCETNCCNSDGKWIHHNVYYASGCHLANSTTHPFKVLLFHRVTVRRQAGNGIATPCLGSKPQELSAVGQRAGMCLGIITCVLELFNPHKLIVQHCLNLCRKVKRKLLREKKG